MIDPKPKNNKATSINTSMAGNTVVTSDRNTPTILGKSENPNKVELKVEEDGSTSVGNYKLGKSSRKFSGELICVYYSNRSRLG